MPELWQINRHLSPYYTGLNNNDGSLGSGSVITVDRSITTVIPAPGGNFFFTDAGPGGYGDWGKITFDSGIDTANSATTAVFAGLVASAHCGTYDPYSNSIILFGSNEVSQWSLAGTFMGSRTFGGANFDQGTVDGAGHLFIASNNGDVLLMDYDASGQVFNLSNPFYHQFLDTYLDDIAPLIGEGGTSTVPEPSTVIGALALSSLFARRILKRK